MQDEKDKRDVALCCAGQFYFWQIEKRPTEMLDGLTFDELTTLYTNAENAGVAKAADAIKKRVYSMLPWTDRITS